MKNTISSLSSRFRLAASLLYASLQLLRIFSLLLLTASRNDWRNHTNSQSSQPQALTQNLDAPLDDPDDWESQDDLSDEDITAIWLDLLSEPEVQQSCTHHLTRCAALPDASKIYKTS